MKTPNTGFALHCHHDTLVEFCYDYKERVAYIKKEKPKSEQEIRLKIFKILPKAALADIPLYWQEAYRKQWEAYRKWREAYRKREEAYRKWREADRKWEEAYRKWREADRKWREADRKWREAEKRWSRKAKDAFHKKWCVPDCPWDGEEIIFTKKIEI